MSDELVKFVGTMVGSFISFGSAFTVMYYSLRNQNRLELERWTRAQQDDLKRWERAQADELEKWRRNQDELKRTSVRSAVAELGKHLAGAAHSACWLTWDAKAYPVHITLERMKEYDVEIHKRFDNLATAGALLAALDVERYRQLRSVMDEFEKLDFQIGTAGRMLEKSPKEAVGLLVQCHQDGMALVKRVPEAVGAALSGLH